MKQQTKKPNNIREIRIVKPEKPRHGLTRKYTFNVKPKIVEFENFYDLYFICQGYGIQNLCRMSRNEMCRSINVEMKPRKKSGNSVERKIPVYTCAEKPKEIDQCCLRRLRQMGRKAEVVDWSRMNREKLCNALNVVFKV